MNYTMIWLPRAVAQLTALYIRAADKEMVTPFTDGIDQVLARDPSD